MDLERYFSNQHTKTYQTTMSLEEYKAQFTDEFSGYTVTDIENGIQVEWMIDGRGNAFIATCVFSEDYLHNTITVTARYASLWLIQIGLVVWAALSIYNLFFEPFYSLWILAPAFPMFWAYIVTNRNEFLERLAPDPHAKAATPKRKRVNF
ncbi:MAG: hypothetical protein KC496_08030 [Anaerolineae bacterium]|nr:hypothetical protein [Anaerolineae bacterium]